MEQKDMEILVNSRLSMQSTNRALAFYGMSQFTTYESLLTEAFRKALSVWPEAQRTNAMKIIGGVYWKQITNIIESK